ncbi:MAG: RNA 2',3'-cyclic phosphodiesterase [Actinobacteria bacterium]|nr:RNA 2',3'-cyclic phosphodiesterase [Actinomycetota bacterium]
MARLFVAVRPPVKVLRAVEKALGPARRAMVGPRWTTDDQWHLTLQFLGAVPEESVSEVSRALDAVSKVQAFPARIGGGGAVPRVSRARVIWLGLAAGAEGMAELARAVGMALAPLGFEAEERDFHAHLTLARLKVSGDVTPAVAALGTEPVGPAFVVSEVVLYESHLSPKGARYEAVSAVALEG